MYLTYEEYAGMGGGVDAVAFLPLEEKARSQIDRATHGRLKGEEPVRDAAKRCAYELIEEIRMEEEARAADAGREISGMSSDGISVSFAAQSNAVGAAARREQILRDWLGDELSRSGVNLLYAGSDA